MHCDAAAVIHCIATSAPLRRELASGEGRAGVRLQDAMDTQGNRGMGAKVVELVRSARSNHNNHFNHP